MVEKQHILYTVDTIKNVVEALDGLKTRSHIFALTGSLGAGKTTLAQSLCRFWGVSEPVTSPTFAYMNIYKGVDDLVVYHFDLYRIESVDAFLYAGFDEYLSIPNSRVIIEWPEVIEPILKNSVCFVHLNYIDFESRIAEIIQNL